MPHIHTRTLTHSLTSINSDKRTIVKVDWRLSRRQRHTNIMCDRSHSRFHIHKHTHICALVAQESDSMSEIDRTRDSKIIRLNEHACTDHKGSKAKQNKSKEKQTRAAYHKREIS